MPADRRTFVKTLGAATLRSAHGSGHGDGATPTAKPAAPVRFGVDMYSLAQQNWTPFQQMDFAAKWNVKVVHFSEIRFLGILEPRQPEEGARARRRARARSRDRHAIDLSDVGDVRQGAGHCRRTAGADGRRREDRALADRPRRARQRRRPARRHREAHRLDGRGAQELAVAGRWMPASRSRSRTTPATCRRAN